MTITSGAIDFIESFNRIGQANAWRSGFHAIQDGYIQVNEYWYHQHFDGQAREALKELIEAMDKGNHDNSDIQTDYFDVGWYTNINIGKWNKPYQRTLWVDQK